MGESMEPWKRQRMLILGMTYPHYSTKYHENVCTGALLEDGAGMVRVHPIPRRYLDEGHQFKSWQWVTALTQTHTGDPRPESLRVEPNSIELGDVEDDALARRAMLLKSPHLCTSVEELKDRYDQREQSLGIVRPKIISRCRVHMRSVAERDAWLKKENSLLAQGVLLERPPRKIDFPEARFEITFECDDPRCEGHSMNMLQWGLHELYRTLKNRRDPECVAKVEDAMRRRLDLEKYEVFLFLGNFRGTMFNFGLMDSYSFPKAKADKPAKPPKRPPPAQGSLF
jgi:hypothetical protein